MHVPLKHRLVSHFDVFPTNHQYYCFYPFFRIPFCKLSPRGNSLCRTCQFHFPGSQAAHSPFRCSAIRLSSPPDMSKSRPAPSRLRLPALHTRPVHRVGYRQLEVPTFDQTDIIHSALRSLPSSPSLLPRSLLPRLKHLIYRAVYPRTPCDLPPTVISSDAAFSLEDGCQGHSTLSLLSRWCILYYHMDYSNLT